MIIFTGVAGSGKSVQGKMLADALGFPWLSTGEFLRMVISGERRQHMLEGKLLSDAEIIAVVEKIFAMIDVKEQFVLDGFPRTVAQVAWLLKFSAQQQASQPIVIHMTASEDTVRSRLLERGRKDDHEEAITARFEEYEQAIKPILEAFRRANIPVIDIDAERSVEDVHQEVLNTVIQKTS